MGDVKIELCPETGICSIIKTDGSKIDLMPDEVQQVRDASGSPDAIKQTIAQIDSGFAQKLDPGDVDQVSAGLK